MDAKMRKAISDSIDDAKRGKVPEGQEMFDFVMRLLRLAPPGIAAVNAITFAAKLVKENTRGILDCSNEQGFSKRAVTAYNKIGVALEELGAALDEACDDIQRNTPN